MQKNRYPGIYSFSTEQKEVFFGRDADAARLFELINIEPLTLLYSKSGMGKSSLINAGLVPLLTDDYLYIPVRFGAYTGENSEAPLARTSRLLKQYRKGKTYLDRIEDEEGSLWYLAKSLQAENNKKVLLVFDQFEELASYPTKDITAFKTQLAEMLYARISSLFRELVDEIVEDEPEFLLPNELNLLNKKQEVSVMFSIRNDRMSFLNQLTDFLPNIQKNFHELQALTTDQARTAITAPANKDGDFSSPKFEYDKAALNKILKYLTQDYSQNVESTQLQIVCQRIEFNFINPAGLEDPQGLVSENDIPDFKNIFFDFYNNAVVSLPELKQADARKLIENELIRNQQRISLDGRICTDYLPEKELQQLVNTHLLRAEPNNVGGYSYELSHDTLIAPIHEAAEKRREAEEEEKQIQIRNEELRIEKETAEKERIEMLRERKRQRLIITIVSVAAVISIALAVFALFQMNAAQKAKKQAENLVIEVKRKDSLNRDAQFGRFHTEANAEMQSGNFVRAIELFDYAKDFTSDTTMLNIEIEACRQKAGNSLKFADLMKNAETEAKNKNYEQAIKLYGEAKELDISPTEVSEALNELKRKIDALLAENRNFAKVTENIDPTKAARYRATANNYASLSRQIVSVLKTDR